MIARHFCNDRCICNNLARAETLRFVARDTVYMDEHFSLSLTNTSICASALIWIKSLSKIELHQ